MKIHIRFIILYLFIMVFLYGCQKVPASRDAKIPDFIVGRWKAEQEQCEFVFDSNGVVAFKNFIGHYIETEEGGSYEAGRADSYVMSVLGPVDVIYDPNTRELNVAIITEYFRMEILDGLIEGKSKDEFFGQITKDGKTWHSTWNNRIVMLDMEPDKETVTTKKVTLKKIK